MRPLAQADNKDAEFTPLSLFNYFVNRCRENLHIILAFSPIGDAFRNRLRKFPSLINCCTIDWFQAWPDDALGVFDKGCHHHQCHVSHAHTHTHTTHSHTIPMNTELVANRFLEEVHLEDKERAATIVLCKHFHQSTRELSER